MEKKGATPGARGKGPGFPIGYPFLKVFGHVPLTPKEESLTGIHQHTKWKSKGLGPQARAPGPGPGPRPRAPGPGARAKNQTLKILKTNFWLKTGPI